MKEFPHVPDLSKLFTTNVQKEPWLVWFENTVKLRFHFKIYCFLLPVCMQPLLRAQ